MYPQVLDFYIIIEVVVNWVEMIVLMILIKLIERLTSIDISYWKMLKKLYLNCQTNVHWIIYC